MLNAKCQITDTLDATGPNVLLIFALLVETDLTHFMACQQVG